jgi:hypothetical protein
LIEVTNMPAASLNPFKSIDRYFLICKIITLLICIPWPLTLLASVMSLAGHFQENTPLLMRVLVRLGWLLILVYPLVFFAIVLFAERVLARKSYPAAAVVVLLPIGFTLFAAAKLFVM